MSQAQTVVARDDLAAVSENRINGDTGAFDAKHGWSFIDDDGDRIAIKLSGAGNGTIDAARRIVLSGTSANTVLSVRVQKGGDGDGMVQLNGITSDGLLKGISAAAAAISGEVLINANCVAAGGRTVTLELGTICGGSIQSAGLPIASLTLLDWQATGDNADLLTAPSIGLIRVQGRRESLTTEREEFLPGDLSAQVHVEGTVRAIAVKGAVTGNIDVGGNIGVLKAGSMTGATAVTGTNRKGVAIGLVAIDGSTDGLRLRADNGSITTMTIKGDASHLDVHARSISHLLDVRGALSNSLIHTQGDVGDVRLGAMFSSHILVGIDDTVGDDTATSSDQFLTEPRPATLRSITIRGLAKGKGEASYPVAVSDSTVSAGKAGAVSLVNLETRTSFGLAMYPGLPGGLSRIIMKDQNDPSMNASWTYRRKTPDSEPNAVFSDIMLPVRVRQPWGNLYALKLPDAFDIWSIASVVQPDGRLVLCGEGEFGGPDGDFYSFVVRLNTDQTLDNTFGNNGMVILDDRASGRLLLLPDGDILIGGSAYPIDGDYFEEGSHGAVRCLKSDGSVDTSFGQDGICHLPNMYHGNEDVSQLVLGRDGTIWAGISVQMRDGSGNYRFGVAHLNHQGVADYAFGSQGIAALQSELNGYSTIRDMAPTDTGGILVSTNTYTYTNGADHPQLFNLNANGTQNARYDAASPSLRGIIRFGHVVALPGGDAIVEAIDSDYRCTLWRLHQETFTPIPFGISADVTSGSPGRTATFQSMTLNSDGDLQIVGTIENWAFTQTMTLEGQMISAAGGSVSPGQELVQALQATDGSLILQTQTAFWNQQGDYQRTVWTGRPQPVALTLPIPALPPSPPEPELTPEQLRSAMEQSESARVATASITGGGTLVLMNSLDSDADPALPWAHHPCLIRLLADGAVDTDFGDFGLVTLPDSLRHAGALAVTDSYILIGGNGTDDPTALGEGPFLDPTLVRLLPDGTLDARVNGGVRVLPDVNQSVDTITQLVVAYDTQYLGIQVHYPGADVSDRDDVTATAGQAYNSWWDVSYQVLDYPGTSTADYDRLVGMNVTPHGAMQLTIDHSGTISQFRLDQLDSILPENMPFEPPSDVLAACPEEVLGWYLKNVTSAAFPRLVKQQDGRVLLMVTGYVAGQDGTYVMRFASDYSLDTSFGQDGVVLLPLDWGAQGITVLANGKILCYGQVWGPVTTRAAIVELTPDGKLDAAFGSGGVVKLPALSGREDDISCLAIAADGKIALGVLSSGSNGYRARAMRLDSSGALDESFGSHGTFMLPNPDSSDSIRGISVLANGQMLVAHSGRVLWIDSEGTVSNVVSNNQYPSSNLLALPDGRCVWLTFGEYYNSPLEVKMWTFYDGSLTSRTVNAPSGYRYDGSEWVELAANSDGTLRVEGQLGGYAIKWGLKRNGDVVNAREAMMSWGSAVFLTDDLVLSCSDISFFSEQVPHDLTDRTVLRWYRAHEPGIVNQPTPRVPSE